ncbi:alpha/beta hydrolase [Microbacterium sp. G2-8]|uniref:alpha/beta fold hydrolase n=1 Tax=Microbacterium sp. G2-8 TaxID=2842454 RepID=UPI0027E3745B|nr:alpha/beta hydrolase [Microbacterium sp. G2-8]
MTPTHADFDEFAFLPEQAREQGAGAPAVRRVTLPLHDGRSLSGLLFGEGAPRVVFVHGAGLNAHTWGRTVIALGQPVLALDLPGHGDSSWRDDAAYVPHAMAPDLIAAIEEWTATPVTLVGHSLGGFAAIAVADQRPDLVAHLALVDIVPGAGGAGVRGLGAFYERLEFATVNDVVDHAMGFGLGGEREQALRGVLLNTRTRADGVVEWKHHMARLFSPSAPDAALREIDHDGGWAALARVSSSVSLVAGSRGYLSDGDLARFRDVRPHAQVLTLDGSHNVQESAYLDLAHHVRDHLPSA